MVFQKYVTLIETPAGRKWICDICGTTFKKWTYFKQHFRRYHQSDILKDDSSTAVSCDNKEHAEANTEEAMLEEVEDIGFQTEYTEFINSVHGSTGESLIEVKGDFDESEKTLSDRGPVSNKSEDVTTGGFDEMGSTLTIRADKSDNLETEEKEKAMDLSETYVITDKSDKLPNRQTENTNCDIQVVFHEPKVDVPERRRPPCNICGKTFKKMIYLKKHLQNVHGQKKCKGNASATEPNKDRCTIKTNGKKSKELNDSGFNNDSMSFIASLENNTGENLMEVTDNIDETGNFIIPNKYVHTTARNLDVNADGYYETGNFQPNTDVHVTGRNEHVNAERFYESGNIIPNREVHMTDRIQHVNVDGFLETGNIIPNSDVYTTDRNRFYETGNLIPDRGLHITDRNQHVNADAFDATGSLMPYRDVDITNRNRFYENSYTLTNRDIHITGRNQGINADHFEATGSNISATVGLISDTNDEMFENENVKTKQNGNTVHRNSGKKYVEVIKYICDHCETTFKKRMYLTKHLKSRHNIQKSEDSVYRTTVCYEKVKAKKTAVAQNTYNCKFCQMSCKKKSYLWRHIKKHHGEHTDEIQKLKDESLNQAASQVDQTVKVEVEGDLECNDEKFSTGHAEVEKKVFHLDVQFDCKNDVLNRNVDITDTGHKVISAKSVVNDGCSLGDMIISMRDLLGDVQIKPEDIQFELKGNAMKFRIMYQ